VLLSFDRNPKYVVNVVVKVLIGAVACCKNSKNSAFAAIVAVDCAGAAPALLYHQKGCEKPCVVVVVVGEIVKAVVDVAVIGAEEPRPPETPKQCCEVKFLP